MTQAKALSNGSDGQFVFKSELQGIRQIRAVTGNLFRCLVTIFSIRH